MDWATACCASWGWAFARRRSCLCATTRRVPAEGVAARVSLPRQAPDRVRLLRTVDQGVDGARHQDQRRAVVAHLPEQTAEDASGQAVLTFVEQPQRLSVLGLNFLPLWMIGRHQL